MENIWHTTKYNVRESIILETWEHDDWKMDQLEEKTLRYFQISLDIVYTGRIQVPLLVNPFTLDFSLPPNGFIKLSFNSASKGNLGPSRFSGILRDDQGHIRQLYA